MLFWYEYEDSIGPIHVMSWEAFSLLLSSQNEFLKCLVKLISNSSGPGTFDLDSLLI